MTISKYQDSEIAIGMGNTSYYTRAPEAEIETNTMMKNHALTLIPGYAKFFYRAPEAFKTLMEEMAAIQPKEKWEALLDSWKMGQAMIQKK